MKNSLILIVGMLLSAAGFSQSIKSYVITSAGASMMNSEGALYLSIGEPLNTEIQEGEIMLSQGFLQVSVLAGLVSNTELLDEPIHTYPNPTGAQLNIDLPEMDGTYQYLLQDITGKLIKKDVLPSTKNNIDLSAYDSGVYFMKVVKDDKRSLTVKIIKQ